MQSKSRIIIRCSLVRMGFCYLPLFALICGLVTMPANVDGLGVSVPTGLWGGEHIRLTVTETGASVEFDCAFGKIDRPLLLDKEGNFEVRGVYMAERGGPRRLEGEPAVRPHAALFYGWTDGSQMRLRVTLPDTGTDIGTFLLGLGDRPQLEKCL